MITFTEEPDQPVVGQTFYSMSDNALRVYTGTEWRKATTVSFETLTWLECNKIESEKLMGTYEPV